MLVIHSHLLAIKHMIKSVRAVGGGHSMYRGKNGKVSTSILIQRTLESYIVVEVIFWHDIIPLL